MAKADPTTPSRRATLLGAVSIASAAVAVPGSAKASAISPALQKAFDEWQSLVIIERKADADLDRAEGRLDELRPQCPKEILRGNTHHGVSLVSYGGDFAYVRGVGPRLEYATAAGFRRILAEYSELELRTGLTDHQLERRAEAEHLLAKAKDYEAAIAAADEMSGVDAAADNAHEAFLASHEAFVRFTRIRPKTMGEVQFQATHIAEWCEEGEYLEEFVLDWMKSLAQFVS